MLRKVASGSIQRNMKTDFFMRDSRCAKAANPWDILRGRGKQILLPIWLMVPGKLRYHPLTDWLRGLIRPALRAMLAGEERLLARAWRLHSLEPPNRVLDIGANEGIFTRHFLRMGAREILAVEPDAEAIRIFSHRHGQNRRVTLLNLALATRNGWSSFYRIKPASGFNTLSRRWFRVQGGIEGEITKVRTETLPEIFRRFGIPDLIKVDTEGLEWSILRHLSQPVPFLCFEANLPTFSKETRALLNHLQPLMPNHWLCIAENQMLSSPLSLKAALQLCEGNERVCLDFFFIFPRPCGNNGEYPLRCRNSENGT